MELISIIIPVYEVEKYLEECIETVVHQTYKNLEIILVDDGSTDNSGNICDSWGKKDNRIRIIHKENGGLSEARNAGLSIATGRYIAFVDSDDWIEKNYIEYMYQALQNTDSELAACEVNYVLDGMMVVEKIETSGRIMKSTPKEALEEMLQGRGFRAVAWNKLYKADLLAGEKFEVGRLHEDEFFTYRVLDKASSLVFVDIPLYNYRQREGSIMATLSIRHLDLLDAYMARLKFLKSKYPDLYRRDKVTFCLTCLSFYYDTLKNKFIDNQDAQNKIKFFRKNITFTLRELFSYSFKEQIYIIGSSILFIDVFSKLKLCKGH